ncbi:MAG TPA: hypothetical protein VEX35_03190 [Allosphingosinicella sp.]|nr:hypothetical protein [Allosphingosinicella sp.]
MELADRIAALSDFAAVAACQDLATALAARSGVALADAVDELPPELIGRFDPSALKEGLDMGYDIALPPEVSVQLARAMLLAAAEDETTAPVLAKVLDESSDTRQFALEVLAIGAALSMVIFSATSSYGKDGFGKAALSPELAEKIGGWLDKLRPWVGGGSAA